MLAREGGLDSPQPGRKPAGAKNNAINPASSNIPSDWYPENSRAAATKERKQTKQMKSETRGQIFITTRSEAIIPTQQRKISMCELAEYQSTVGANQKRLFPGNSRATAGRKSEAGRIPCGPMSPRI